MLGGERFAPSGRRYRVSGSQLYVADPDGDGGYRTVQMVDLEVVGGHSEADRRDVHEARRLGLDVGDSERVALEARQALLGLGDSWRTDLGGLDGPGPLIGARVTAVDDPLVFDTVELVDGTQLYLRDGEHYPGWVIVGWSDASRARRYRPTVEPLPSCPDDHDPS